MSLKDEIFEQPNVLQRLIDTQWSTVQTIAQDLKQRQDTDRRIDYVFLTARGTSDHAGLYAKYLWGAHNQLPVALAAPSLFSVYRLPPRLDRALVVGISQSGQSPDIVSVLEEARRQGAPTLSITNAPDSPLAQASEWVIDASAGPELAVAASKSYTAQLAAIAMLSVALDGDPGRFDALCRMPVALEQVLTADTAISQIAERYRYMTQCVILGRGYNYATAYEWALKLKELTYTVAAPYSSADFQHGPVAMVSEGFPVFAVMPQGAVFEDLFGLIKQLKSEHKVELFILSNGSEALTLADRAVALPDDLPEWLSPLVAIVPGQLFCYHLTKAKGYDTENPRMLNKITKTE
jgi:glucosamine--fructose-6-phosphate aminotransferase (isomerizing)